MQGSANLNVMIKAARKAGRSLVKDFQEVEKPLLHPLRCSPRLQGRGKAGGRPHRRRREHPQHQHQGRQEHPQGL